MRDKTYQRLMKKRKKKALNHIERRSIELRRRIRVFPFNKMINEVSLMRSELEHIARSNHR